MRDFGADPQAIMDAHAKSFSWAVRFLDASARKQATQLYAFARWMDDLVDEPGLGTQNERMALFEAHRQQVLSHTSQAGRSAEAGQMLRVLGVDGQVICSFLDGLQADAQPRHLQSLPEVLSFAYGVAGTVGQMMRPILGAQRDAERHAVALGMAMQLTNIARDVLEDAQRERCYLPAQWLPADWQLPNLLAGHAESRQQAHVAIVRLLAEAEALYALAEQGFAAIPAPNRRAIHIACVLYRGIGRKILQMPEPVYWQQRMHLTRWEKIRSVAQVMLGLPRRKNVPSADALQAHHSVLQRIPGFPSAMA